MEEQRESATERWQSGLMYSLGKRESGQTDRGFESPPLLVKNEGPAVCGAFSMSNVFATCATPLKLLTYLGVALVDADRLH